MVKRFSGSFIIEVDEAKASQFNKGHSFERMYIMENWVAMLIDGATTSEFTLLPLKEINDQETGSSDHGAEPETGVSG